MSAGGLEEVLVVKAAGESMAVTARVLLIAAGIGMHCD